MRSERLRQEGIQGRVIDARWISPTQTARHLVAIYDGGSIPTTVPSVFLTHPVWVDADDTEGATPSTSTDTSQTIPVVVIGPTVPVAGEMVVAHAIGGRWVAEYGLSTGGTLSCYPCAIPLTTLALSWVNSSLGNGSTTLTQDTSISWKSGCTNQLLYAFGCISGFLYFEVDYFISGSCPTGQKLFCSAPGSSPNGLTLSSYTCDPFSVTYTLTSSSCPTLWAEGYTSFTITE